jgi:hypothetical protein
MTSDWLHLENSTAATSPEKTLKTDRVVISQATGGER